MNESLVQVVFFAVLLAASAIVELIGRARRSDGGGEEPIFPEFPSEDPDFGVDDTSALVLSEYDGVEREVQQAPASDVIEGGEIGVHPQRRPEVRLSGIGKRDVAEEGVSRQAGRRAPGSPAAVPSSRPVLGARQVLGGMDSSALRRAVVIREVIGPARGLQFSDDRYEVSTGHLPSSGNSPRPPGRESRC